MTTKKATTKKAARKKSADLEALLERIEAAEARADAAEKKLESMQDEEARLAAKEAELDRIAKERYEEQQKNRRDPKRIAKLLAPRDPSIIRGDGDIKCITLAKIGISETETSDINETVMLTKEAATKLQDAGKIKVVL